MKPPPSYSFDRISYRIFHREQGSYGTSYGRRSEDISLEVHRLVPRERDSSTVLAFIHPVGNSAYLPIVTALARAGHQVLVCGTRYRCDTALTLESCAVDVGVCIRHARDTLGYRRVVLGGWNGGGPLALLYQAEAESPSVRSTPAGDPPDLTHAGLIPADAVMLFAAHVGRAQALTEGLDPSIRDEERPFERDPQLNLYDAANPHQPPYSREYLERFRKAQRDRNQRITEWARRRLEELRTGPRCLQEHCFVVYGTMADPRWLDPAVDPNQRRPGWCHLGEPELVNDGPIGRARFCTLRGWLSQWSLSASRGDGAACAARTSVPTLILDNCADDACPPTHARQLFKALRHRDRELHRIEGATHAYAGQLDKLGEATRLCSDWLTRHRLQ